MRKYTILFLALLLVLLGSTLDYVPRNKNLEQSIEAAMKNKAKDEDRIEVDIVSLTNFDWDQAFLFTPYTPQESIDEQLKIHFKDPSNIDTRDDIYLMIFMKDDKVVQYAEINKEEAYLSMGEEGYLTPTKANIDISWN